MNAKQQREIVIEFEKVQTIRRRARTTLTMCVGCGEIADQVSLAEAAELFETARDSLFSFITQHGCHFENRGDSDIYLCVTSLLERLKNQSELRRLTA